MAVIKDFISKITSKPKMRNWLILGLFGIMLLIGASTLLESDKPAPQDPVTNKNSGIAAGREQDPAYKNKENLEKDIEDILSSIENAGKVKVLITYENGGELVPDKDTNQKDTNTTEEDGQGGKRNTSDKQSDSTTVYEQQGSDKSPFVIKEVYPEIRGVVVVAQGAGDQVVVGKITRALEVLLKVPVHKIQVVK